MYRLSISRDFIARHYLVGGDWGRENVEHSHRYKVQIEVSGSTLDEHGYLVDIVALESALLGVIDQYRDRLLNELEPFQGKNPSLEHFARIIWESMRASGVPLERQLNVKVWENEQDWAAYTTGAGD
jgi:6-pyruvoyltetrahydropterin/6-carboxytetrahydropterin synthase